jgi:outer membrane protein assembly factor BamB
MTTTREKLYIQAINLFSEYDPKSRVWRDLPKSNDYLGTAVGLDGKIYQIHSNQKVFAFDIDTEKWEPKPSIPYPALGMGATVLNGKIYLMGRDGILQSYDPNDDP